MKQFYEAYCGDEKLSAVLTEFPATMVAEYETKLINKSLLQKKLHELGNLVFSAS